MIVLVDCGSNKTDAIEAVVRQSTGACQRVLLDEFAPNQVHGASGLVVGGSPSLLQNRDLTGDLKRMQFLKELEIPMLGICFGHQLFGLLHGATHWMGKPVRTNELICQLRPSAIFEALPQQFLMQEDHTEYISLPKAFVLTARSASATNEAMQHTDKPIFGVQFHPEVSGVLGEQLLFSFLRLCAGY